MDHYIDTHAHIYHDDFDADRVDLMHRSHEQGIGKIFMPNVDHTSIDKMLDLESRWPEVTYAMMGLHPCSVKKDFERELYTVETWLGKRTFAAIGEIGTDLYWDKTFWEQQREAFGIQVNWSRKYELPIIIHCRESLNETIEMIEQFQDGKLTGIFHCFTGSAEQAERIGKLGFYVGIGGVVTFKNGGLDKVLPEIGLQKVVLETDSPYLAPVPYRGKRNEPTYIPLISAKIAEILRVPVEEVKQVTTQNAMTVFKHIV